MDCQVVTTKRELECILFDESAEAKVLSLSLLKCITDNFSDNLEIGRGGFAVVYKGLLGNVPVAVKKLSKIDEEKFSGEYDGKPVMADICERLLCFEYLPNGSLDEYIKDAPLVWRKHYQIIKGVCEGLRYLHEKQIVHSDLKPANILLDNDMVAKITDFGISRCFDGKQTHAITKNVIFSPGYAAPEVFNGKFSFKSDIYSLGVIIIEILTADKGYPVAEDVLEHWGHKEEESQKEHQLEVEQIRVCTEVGRSCLQYDPVKRPSAQCIIDILEQTESKVPSIETGKRRLPFRRHTTMNPITVAKALKAVTQAICLFYDSEERSYQYEQLYSYGYDLVLNKKGEELYLAVVETMSSEVQSLCRPLDAAPADSVSFLQELLAKWNQHVQAVTRTRDILMYMERTLIPRSRKKPIKELGLCVWRDHMARSEKIRPRVIESVNRQRGGEGELVAGVNKMLTELGAEVMDVPCLFFRDGAGELHVAGP
ncbi:Cysteine-rich receptor-like protein kinase 7 [Dichanthelium oligosanthes]|uniref:non-specific serine/threonine protein kinase n=1 Tax=Dichanthelium oligosanthes TaxID=888268 RepID=A0A1E5V1C2_9POAL|nr:Cysteine-rich receptor-like protein kinase 7 [Dichanthelium oligosanthes]